MNKAVAVFIAIVIPVAQGICGVSLAADLPLRPAIKPPPAAPAKTKAEGEFDDLGADCLAATDGCRNFLRDTDGRFDPANNIGIACQPQKLTCTKRR